jgi:hypothetical protein
MTAKDEVMLNTQERNLLRKEYGSVSGQEKIRTNQDLTFLYTSSDPYYKNAGVVAM